MCFDSLNQVCKTSPTKKPDRRRFYCDRARGGQPWAQEFVRTPVMIRIRTAFPSIMNIMGVRTSTTPVAWAEYSESLSVTDTFVGSDCLTACDALQCPLARTRI
ncbi:hypothetical protein BDR03DRAFT_948593 [Suillus americanus]|nr:hypothetical protein BDR03DRAFT_948593 [Suillus americanus]